MKDFYTVNEIIEEMKINNKSQIRDIIVFNTLDCLVRRLFYLVSNMPDEAFNQYLSFQREMIKNNKEKQNKDFEFVEMFFNLLERKRKEYKALKTE